MSKKVQNQVWSSMGKALYLTDKADQVETLDNAVYKMSIDSDGRFFLRKIQESFNFDYKLYGLETSLIERVLRTYEKTDSGNIGVLLNGLKGTGKTITSKIICNKLNQPVIVVSTAIKGCHIFLNSIPQNITVFIDEYEKIFGDSSDMLTIMDGALNSQFRRVFMLTTNKLNVDENLIQRPSRIRYLKKFEDLTPSVVTEIVDDILEHKELRMDCIKFISNLEIITVDIVKAVLQEVNIHNESPEVFKKVFNVKKISGKFNISVKGDDGIFASLIDDCTCNPKPMFNENRLGDWLSIDGNYIGNITKIIGWNTIEISPVKNDDSTAKWLKKPMILKMEDADMVHYSYKYGEDMGGYETPPTTTKRSNLSQIVTAEIKSIRLNEGEDENYDIPTDTVSEPISGN